MDEETQQMLGLGAIAVVGYVAYSNYKTVEESVTNPAQTTTDAVKWATGQLKTGYANIGDHLAGSTDESIGRQFDNTAGGGFGDMYLNQVEKTYNAMTPDASTVENTWNKYTPDVGTPSNIVTETNSTVEKAGSRVEDTWNKVTPDVGNLW